MNELLAPLGPMILEEIFKFFKSIGNEIEDINADSRFILNQTFDEGWRQIYVYSFFPNPPYTN